MKVGKFKKISVSYENTVLNKETTVDFNKPAEVKMLGGFMMITVIPTGNVYLYYEKNILSLYGEK